MLVKDVMTRNPVTVPVNTSVPEVTEIMNKQNVSKLPVLGKNGSLAGIVTKADLIKSTPSSATTLDMFELSYLLSKLTVEKVMVRKVRTATENETVEEAARLMADYGISCLPIMRDDLLVGIITEGDLFRAFIDMFGTRYAGVRATFSVPDQPGALSALSKQIADLNGNIVSFVTADSKDSSRRGITLRVTGLSLSQVQSIIENCSGTLEDIRNV